MARNPLLTKGVPRYSKSAANARKGMWAVKNKGKAAKKTPAGALATRKAAAAAAAPKKAVRYVPTEPVKQPKKRSFTPKTAALRPSITKGTVVILLAGAHRGKRVVVLDQLKSGLLLVTGPFKINGVPLRRVNQAYVIATQTRVDAAAQLKLSDAALDDATYASRAAAARGASGGAGEKKKEFFDNDAEMGDAGGKKKASHKKTAFGKAHVGDDAKKLQEDVDKPLLAAIKQNKTLAAYLGAKFSLSNGQKPHAMKF